MSDQLYSPKVYRRQGGDVMVVGSGGKIVVQAGGYITASGESAGAHVTDAPTSTAADAAENATRINLILARLEGVGINATS